MCTQKIWEIDVTFEMQFFFLLTNFNIKLEKKSYSCARDNGKIRILFYIKETILEKKIKLSFRFNVTSASQG